MKRPSDHPSLWQKGIALTWKSWFHFSVPVKPVVFLCLEGQKAMKCLASKNLISGLSAAEVGWREEWQFVVSAVLKDAGVRKMVVFGPSFGCERKDILSWEIWGRHVLVNHGWEPYLGLACASNFAMAVEISSEASANLANQFACPCSIFSFLLCAYWPYFFGIHATFCVFMIGIVMGIHPKYIQQKWLFKDSPTIGMV